MKNTKKLLHLSLVVIMGLMLITCQKDESEILYSEADTEAPQLKSVVYNEDYWQHLSLTYNAINTLLSEGYLNKGNANALLVKFEAARMNLLKGKYDAAEGILTAFMNMVEDLVDEGIILPEQGEELVLVPGAIIESFYHQCGDPIYDVRDGQTYKTVQIGGQCWLAENLNFKTELSVYYENNRDNLFSVYGYLYPMNPDVINLACPIGWHLPSDDEWKTLEKYLGMNDTDADNTGLRSSGDVDYKLKSNSSVYPGWVLGGHGDNSSGFNALPGGTGYLDGTYEFDYYRMKSSFWSSTYEMGNYWVRNLRYDKNGVERIILNGRNRLSIRCVKND